MNQKEIKDFIKSNIDLDENKYNNIIKKYKQSKELLEKNGFKKIRRQGSVATKTSIKPKNPNQEYDLDIAIEINNDEFIENKDNLEKYLKEEFLNVERKDKCINVKWNNQFNADYTIIKNINNEQTIYDESNKEKITSNNIELINIINDIFSKSTNDALRDCSKLLKFYLRQHKKTDGLLPSIVQNLLITSNFAPKEHGYEGQICTTLANIGNYFKKLIEKKEILFYYKNPTNENNNIHTKINNIDDFKNIILVIDDLIIDIKESGLRSLKINSDIRSKNISSTISVKPWMK